MTGLRRRARAHDPERPARHRAVAVSVDAIEHWMIYLAHPEVGAILHVHAWVEGVPSTEIAYPCGSEELARAVAGLAAAAPDPGRAIVGLHNHGITATGSSLTERRRRDGGAGLPSRLLRREDGREGRPGPSRALRVPTPAGGVSLDVAALVLETGGDQPLCVHLLRETANGTPVQPRGRGFLSPRQLEVLSLLAEGLSAKAIAQRLGIANLTARNHIRAIREALGCHSQLEAVAEARRRRLV